MHGFLSVHNTRNTAHQEKYGLTVWVIIIAVALQVNIHAFDRSSLLLRIHQELLDNMHDYTDWNGEGDSRSGKNSQGSFRGLRSIGNPLNTFVYGFWVSDFMVVASNEVCLLL